MARHNTPHKAAGTIDDPTIAVVCLSRSKEQLIKSFCQSNGLSFLKTKDDDHELLLMVHDDLTELYDRQLDTCIHIDFLHGSMAHRHLYGGGRGQALAKAIGLRSGITPSVLDATAGMAGDAFVLATLGCPVTLAERSPIVFSMIEDAIERASLNESFRPILEQGFVAINADARDYLSAGCEDETEKASAFDVIYIDPMYPERKKSALVKKEMQILQRLHGEDRGSDELLEKAMLCARKRVVVKRPIHAETLSERRPNTCVKSKKTRYDIYTIAKM